MYGSGSLGSVPLGGLATTVTATLIDIASKSTITSTTIIPPDVLGQPKKQRDVNVSQKVIEDLNLPENITDELTSKIHSLLDNGKDGIFLKNDNNPIFINCNFYGSSINGDIQSQQVQLMNQWNCIKDSTDIKKIKSELSELKKYLIEKTENKDSDYQDIANVSNSLEELNKANGAGMVGFLKKTSKDVLDAAKEIGVQVIVDLLTKR